MRTFFTLVLLMALSMPIPASPGLAEHDPDDTRPDATCTSGEVIPLQLELGEGIPLPDEYRNPTNRPVTFSARVNANKLFGPAHDLGKLYTVEPRSILRFGSFSDPVIPTTVGTPLATDRISVAIYIDDDDATVVARCEYLVETIRPRGLSDLVQVPIRWCAVARTPVANGQEAGTLAPANGLRDIMGQVNEDIWVPGAHIALTLPLMATNSPGTGSRVGIPVIGDPDPDPERYQGEVDTGLGGLVAADMARECDSVWRDYDSSIGGAVVVNILRFYRFSPEGNDAGFVFAPSPELWGSKAGSRSEDLCRYPRNLSEDDVAGQLWAVVVDPTAYETSPRIQGNPVYTLGHEFGHMLMLGHGNGLDDNRDGVEPELEGPRFFDEYCDPLGAEEDALTPFVDCPQSASLMEALRCRTTYTLHPLQAELARDVAVLVPGASAPDDCSADAIFLPPECNDEFQGTAPTECSLDEIYLDPECGQELR